MSSTDNFYKVMTLSKSTYVVRELGPRGQAALPPMRGAILRVSILRNHFEFSKAQLSQRCYPGRALAHPPLRALQPALTHPDRIRTTPLGHLSSR